MAIFSKKTKTKAKDVEAKVSAVSAPVTISSRAHVLKGPRITEKASVMQEKGVYTFDIAENATKRDVARAVQALYKVVPRAVRVVAVAPKVKRSMRTGRTGKTDGVRKAYIYLKAGDSITIA